MVLDVPGHGHVRVRHEEIVETGSPGDAKARSERQVPSDARLYEFQTKDGRRIQARVVDPGGMSLLLDVPGRGQMRLRRDEIADIAAVYSEEERTRMQAAEAKRRAILTDEEQGALRQATEQAKSDPFAGFGWMLGEGAAISEKLTREELKEAEATHGSDSMEAAVNSELLGMQQAAQGKIDEAEASLSRALAIYQKTYGANSDHAQRVTRMLEGVREQRRRPK